MYEKERRLLEDTCHMLYRRQLVTACDGNVSMRIGEHVLLTPSGKNKGLVTKEEILVLDLAGNVVEGVGKASKEYPLHRTVYERRPDIEAVVHTHPIYATAFALAGQNIPDNYLIESRMMLGKIALAEYAAPGSEALAAVVSEAVSNHQAVLMKNHGALTLGRDLQDAFNHMEVLESIAKTIIMSRILGEPVIIPEDEMKKLP